jgi:hypothetical protein
MLVIAETVESRDGAFVPDLPDPHRRPGKASEKFPIPFARRSFFPLMHCKNPEIQFHRPFRRAKWSRLTRYDHAIQRSSLVVTLSAQPARAAPLA